MRMSPTLTPLICAALALAAPAAAQVAISAKAGMVHVADGEVFLAGKPLEMQPNSFPDIKEGQVMRTEEGRVEVLLAPGTFLRMGEHSAFKMISNRLIDTRVLIEKGSALIEVVELEEGNSLTVGVGDATVSVAKPGLYSLDTDPVRVRVWEGEVRVSGGDKAAVVKKGKELLASSEVWTARSFDREDTDALYRWARRRSSYVAKANVSAARQAERGLLKGSGSGGWYFNPWLGMMTYIPFGDTFRSPFGYRFFTPWTVQTFYAPRPVYSGGGGGFGGSAYERSFGGSYVGGFGGMSGRSAGGSYSGGGMTAGSAPSAPAAGSAGASAGGGRGAGGAGSAGGRGGAAGGGRQ